MVRPYRRLNDPAGLIPVHDRERLIQGEEARFGSIISADGFTGQPFRPVVDQDVMATCLREQAIDHVDQTAHARFHAGLLAQLTQGRINSPLTRFDSAAGQAPLSRSRRLSTPDQQNPVALQAHDTDRRYGRHEYFAV